MVAREARANRRCDGDGTHAPSPRRRRAATPLDSSRSPADSLRVLPNRRALTLACRLAALAVLVLALGLPRFFVLCAHDGEAAHLEFVHAPGACCDAATQSPADAPADGSPALAAHEHCDHSSLTIEIAPAPRGGELADDASTLLAIAPLPRAVVPALAATATARPAATGPPPWASRLRQQATVRLQV